MLGVALTDALSLTLFCKARKDTERVARGLLSGSLCSRTCSGPLGMRRTCWEVCAKLGGGGGGVGPGHWVWEEMAILREPASSKGPRDEDRRPPGRASGQRYVQSPEAELVARPEGP